jgi:hypothetical protein
LYLPTPSKCCPVKWSQIYRCRMESLERIFTSTAAHWVCNRSKIIMVLMILTLPQVKNTLECACNNYFNSWNLHVLVNASKYNLDEVYSVNNPITGNKKLIYCGNGQVQESTQILCDETSFTRDVEIFPNLTSKGAGISQASQNYSTPYVKAFICEWRLSTWI